MKKQKLAIINQRYGVDVNGGSEYYTRLIAEHLNKYYNVEVLTTTALDYDTWENHYSPGDETVNGVKVKRFSVKHRRNMLQFRIVSKLVRIFSKMGIYLDKWWVKEQGPCTTDLIKYLDEHKSDYDIFIFVTYLYYTTAMGLPKVFDKSILIPTAHDEPYIYFPIYRKIFQKARVCIFLTEEEKMFVRQEFHNYSVPGEVIGVGIDIPEKFQDETACQKAVRDFCQKYNIGDKYIIYAGRVDYGKKCDEMFGYFQKFKRKYPDSRIQLVVIGKDMMGVPNHPDIKYLGFVSDEEKYAGIAGAEYLWLPSEFESLSISLLEAMALGIPGLVNGKCKVLKGHCKKSGAGVYYDDYERVEQVLLGFSNHQSEYKKMSQKAKEYVKTNYQWDIVEQKFVRIIENM